MDAPAPIGILLLDDHASTREPLAFMLDQEPDLAVTAQAGSLAEARALIRHIAAVDVAIIDLGLPDGSGEELITDLRAVFPDAQALVLTYFSDRERLATAVAAGAAGILHKSAPVDEVMIAVRSLHQGEQLLTLDEVVAALRFLDQERHRDLASERLAEDLTTRELDVLRALAEGLSDRAIADRYHVSTATVRTHIGNILAKLDATSRLQALVLAIRRGVVTID
jgi:DNA-binding NarL/FixJ family response regulator